MTATATAPKPARKLGHVTGPCDRPGCPLVHGVKVACERCGNVVCRGCSVSWFEQGAVDADETLVTWCKPCYAEFYPAGTSQE